MRRPRDIIIYGHSALLLQWENRIDPAISQSVHAYTNTVLRHAAVTDAVPAYSSLLVQYDDAQISAYALREWIYDAEITTPEESVPKRHRLPVYYGGEYGPDLAEVAEITGLSERQIIRLHTKTVYRVYQLGFQPGFAFLGLTDEKIAVDRRKNPRPRVKAGSVGLAGRQTGIYPHASPGGWQIIGWCPEEIWNDQSTPHARLQAGDEVEFYVAKKKEPSAPKGEPTKATIKANKKPLQGFKDQIRIECIQSGGGTWLVDNGRRGMRHAGIPSGGPADRRVASRLRKILELSEDTPLLEFTLSGGQWLISGKGQIALGGADIPWKLNGRPAEVYTILDVDGDYLLDGGSAKCGCRGYLAIRGKWAANKKMESVSPGIPGISPLHRGWSTQIQSLDELAYFSDLDPYQHCPDFPLQFGVIPGPEWDMLTEGEKSAFLSATYRVEKNSDRQGLRIAATSLADQAGQADFEVPQLTNRLLSSPVLPGTLQWSPGGGLLLLHDAHTLGGFPRLLLLDKAADIDLCGQLQPGDEFTFRLVS